MKASKIFYNANVLTVDSKNSVASAVAILDGKIVKVGTDAEVLALADDKTEKIDLGKKTLIPGFCDPHGHFFWDSQNLATAVDLNSPPIGKSKVLEDCFKILKDKAAQTPKGGWVMGIGFDDTTIGEKRFMVRQELDALSADHPMIVMHISGHLVVANTKALELMGYTKDTPDPQGGVIRREADGKTPNGVLEEGAIFNLYSVIPHLSIDEFKKAIVENSKKHASMGITSTVEAAMVNPINSEALQQLDAENKLSLRVTLQPMFNEYDKYTAIKQSDYVKLGGVKLLQDGSIQGYTAYLSKPYHTPFNGDANHCGYSIMPRENLCQLILAQHMAGRQIVIHTNGDAATDDVIYAFEQALKAKPVADPRLLLVHAQTIREDQLDRFIELGITPTFFAIHTYYWGDRHKAIFLGPERAERQNPMQSAIKRGIVCTSHCDTPVVPITPLLSMWTCVNRLSASGDLIGKDQRISQVEALRTHTYNPAWQFFQENEKGSIEEGKFADLVVLSEDPTTCDPMAIKDIQVLATYLGGKETHKA